MLVGGSDLGFLGLHIEVVALWRDSHPGLVAAAFFAFYVASAALSLPLATGLTLAAGALFGFWGGLALASFASSAGATLAFLASRFLLRERVRARFGDRARALDARLARDGPLALFTLRLVPVIPFFAINLLMGLTPVRTWTFHWVSQAGMLPGTAVYVNAGTQLATLDSAAGLLSGPVLLSFALLGLFPWIARMIASLLARRRVTARWTPPRRFDRNLVVIGAGSAGLVSAYIAASARAKVTLVEAGAMGGDCLNIGCVPSKTLIRSARLAQQVREAGEYGIDAAMPVVDFPRVMARVRRVITEVEPHDSVARYEAMGVEVLKGYARLVDPWTVEVAAEDGATRRLTTCSVILATGAAPVTPPIPGIDAVGVLTSETLWDAMAARDAVPPRLVVLGGGPIGTELAQAFARLGSRVTQVERGGRLLPREDPEVSAMVRASLEADSVEVLAGHEAKACGTNDGERWIEVEAEGRTRRIPFDDLIAATGRKARLTGFGLEELGIETDRVVTTNGFLETSLPHILAAGDVAGPWQFTHTAGAQGAVAATNAMLGGLWRVRMEERVIPWATFCDPEVARVGLGEQEAREKGIPHEVTRYDLAELDRALADGTARGFVKVLTAPGRDRILGVTIVGTEAGDLIAEFVLAMKHRLGLGKILSAIHIYPTMAEANRGAAGAWRRAHLNPRLLALAGRWHDWRRG